MLKFALERIRLPASAITLILFFFMNHSNRIFIAYGETSSYRVRIGIDQGKVISLLLWVIYIDPLLTVLKTEMLDPYILRPPTLPSNMTGFTSDIIINNLVFMDDSTLISSSKAGLEYMLSITEEFYALNNTSANHQKYVLISNSLPLTTTSTILPVEFHLSLSFLNDIPSISVTPLSITSSFRFLGLITPSGSHLIFWTAYRTAYIAQLADKRGRSLPHKWYLDIKANTTLPDSHDQLLERYVCLPSATSSVTLVQNRHWLVTLDGSDSPLFGKQLSVQPKKDTCMIVHWISDCLSSPGDVIRLRSCPGCEAHIPFPSANKYTAVLPRCIFKVSLLKSLILPTDCERIRQTTTEVISPYSWADLSITVIPYYRRLDILPAFSSSSSIVECDLPVDFPIADLSTLPSPVPLPSGAHYRFYTDGSLVNLGTPEVSMGWSWVQLIPDAGYPNSVASYAHGTIQHWPSST
ncbi:hypothetical protein RclHR1_12140013 [Rhizophagus clarus]|uniref:Reverse transcriptase domain-containing protein n=1 Tax=Rhizophagus clarus TaxID=94130 RepID=A0A2Z6QLF1_9GLOM|nr:hypothetical protein RclHR1_12140013 [Rhizophagus clarus]